MLERIRTACIAGFIFFAIVLYAPAWLVSSFFFLITAAAAWECARLMRLNRNGAAIVVLMLALGCAGSLYHIAWAYASVLAAVVLWLTVVPYALYRYQRQEALPSSWGEEKILLFNLVHLMGFFAAMHLLHQRLGAQIVWLFILIWVSDSAAYFVGRAWGKNALASRISPKKTREGLWGGLVAALLLAWWMHAGSASFAEKNIIFYSLLMILALVMGVMGDLWESILKRRVGAKDSGTLLPGHGGVFDRIDSWIAAMPFFVGLFS